MALKGKILPIIVTFLLITNAVTAYIAYDAKRQNLRYENPYPLIDLSRNFIPQEHFITTLQPLRESLREVADQAAEQDVAISLYVEFLNTGANISINPDTGIWPASLAKIPLALAVMKKVERGEWKLTNELVLMAGDRDDKSGDADNPFSEYPIGTRFTIERLLEELLTNSDNTAYYILQRNLHEDELNQVFTDLGLEDLFTSEGRMSAKEYSRLFRALYVSNFLTREHSQQLLSWLDNSTYDDLLSQSIPSDVPFPHKYGENIDLNVFSDSGIVYVPNRPYLITAMIEADADASWEDAKQRAQELMLDISQKTYDYLADEK